MDENRISLLSLNVNGIAAQNYKARFFASTYLYPQFGNSPDIFCIQETHSDKALEIGLLVLWQYDMAFAHGSVPRSGGLITGFRRNLKYSVQEHKEYCKHACQALLTLCTVNDIEMLIVNTYIHPQVTLDQFNEYLAQLQIEIEKCGCPNVICCGDFNAIMDPVMDSTSQTAKRTLVKFTEDTELCDAYRILNPTSRRMTHFSKQFKSGKRLDYIFVAGFFLNLLREVDILPRREFDHNPVLMTLDTTRTEKGRGYWRFPDPLLDNENFVKHLKGKIGDEVEKNKTCNPAVLWDLVKVCIRRETCHFLFWDGHQDKVQNEKFSAQLASLYYSRDRTQGEEAIALNSRIEKLTDEWNKFWAKLGEKRKKLNIGRRRQEDQKSSKYFFRKFNAIPGSSTYMYDSEGISHTSDVNILNICRKFYAKLYNKKPQECDTPYAFIPDRDSPHLLNELDKNLLEEDFTLEELFKALKGMKKDKAPGMDGLSVAFYQKFWEETGSLIYESISYGCQEKILSPSQRRGVVKLLPKKDKNPAWVQNLRPITLLNVDLKIFTRMLAIRVRSVIDAVIERDQHAFIQGRYLGNSLLDLFSLASAALENDEENLIISLDIEKAFDSVNWTFLYKLLEAYGFPEVFISWIQMLHVGKELRVFNNGHSSREIFVSNGLAQGCSLSPLLFIVCMESLARVVRENKNIEGVTVHAITKKIGLVADDTLLTIKATAQSFSETTAVLKDFEKCSGLKVNYEKSVICRVGKNNGKNYTMESEVNFKWLPKGTPFRYLGTSLAMDNTGQLVEQGNFIFSEPHMRQRVEKLRYNNNSMLGKILIIKTMLASLFVYKFTLLPVPPAFLKKLDTFYYDFLWSGRRHKIAKRSMEQAISKGGFQMLNVYFQNMSLKFRWLSRLVNQQAEMHLWQIQVQNAIRLPLHIFLQLNIHVTRVQAFVKQGHFLPHFWGNVFRLWFAKRYIAATELNANPGEILALPVCYNSVTCFRMPHMDKIYAFFNGINIFTVEQFLRNKDVYMDHPYFQWMRLRLPIHWLMLNVNAECGKTLFFGTVQQKWSVKEIYKALRDASFAPPTAQGAWSREFKTPVSADMWEYAGKNALKIKDIRLRSFHLMTINRGYYMNTVLAKFADVSPLCSFCGKLPETYLHFFWSCEVVQKLVLGFKAFCLDYLDLNPDHFNRDTFIFSAFPSALFTTLMTLLKRFLIACRINNDDPILKAFLKRLLGYIEQDRIRATYAKSLKKHYSFWAGLADDRVRHEFSLAFDL